MKSKKYELVKEDRIALIDDTLLYRIRALIDFNDVKAGDLGGYIESESNLSQSGNCWVYDNAMVYNYAKVYGGAIVKDYARVCGTAKVFDDAMVCGNAKVCDAVVCSYAEVRDNARIFDNAKILGCSILRDYIHIGKDGYIINNNYCEVSPIGSRYDTTTFYQNESGDILVCCGCFNGTIDEFEYKVKETHKDNKYAKEYLSAINMAKIHFNKDNNCED